VTDQKTIADPGSLGLAGFAMTTFVLSVFNAGILDKAAEPVFLCLAWFYGGLVQLLAGMWEFKNRNMFGATAFSSYAAFWIALGTYVYLSTAGGAPLKDSFGSSAMGVFLVSWTFFTFYMWIASLRVSGALSTLFPYCLSRLSCSILRSLGGSAPGRPATSASRRLSWRGTSPPRV
jgi:uncharacterized protein